MNPVHVGKTPRYGSVRKSGFECWITSKGSNSTGQVHLALAELTGIKCVFKVLSFLFVVHLEDAPAPRAPLGIPSKSRRGDPRFGGHRENLCLKSLKKEGMYNKNVNVELRHK